MILKQAEAESSVLTGKRGEEEVRRKEERDGGKEGRKNRGREGRKKGERKEKGREGGKKREEGEGGREQGIAPGNRSYAVSGSASNLFESFSSLYSFKGL